MSKADLIYERVRSLSGPSQNAVLEMVEMMGSGLAAPERSPSADYASMFQELAETWRRETGSMSFLQQRLLHPAYQRIVGMGWPAVPLILAELERGPDHWLWALQAITGEEPARGSSSFADAVRAWLEWGRKRGLLSHAGAKP
jgi:hypothetical protein